jgi:peptidoglycan/xylan/chitin deacetylase (PgdA/CDA1 family)
MNWKNLLAAAAILSASGLVLMHCSPFKKSAKVDPGAGRIRPQNQGTDFPMDLPPGTQLSYNKANVHGPFIAMTFDDGPHASLTPRLLDILRERNIRATFYVVGNRTRPHASIMRRIAAEGHELGNHTYTHPFSPGRWADQPLRDEIQRTHDSILATSGATARSYRPPGGSVSPHQKQWIFNEFGYPTILWAVDPNDWKRPGAAVVTQRILTATRPGYIVLAHDIHPGTIDAMPATLDGLLARGFRFVTVSQLIGLERVRVAQVDEPRKLSLNYGPGGF